MPVDLLFPVLATLIAIGVFLNGLRFARMSANPLAGKRILGMPIEGSELNVDQLNRIGRIQMYFAPVIWVFMMIVTYFGELS